MKLRAIHDNRKRRQGWTLLETLFAFGAALLVITPTMVAYFFMNRTLDATANYEELDRQSRSALDIITSDIREAGGLTNYSTNSLSFTNQDGSLLQFTWDGANYLTYTNASTTLSGCPRGGRLLKNCTYLAFDIYQRNPTSNTTMTFTPAPSTNPALAKVVVMNWVCKRTNYMSLTDSESVQTAKVVMRN
jgi:YD repeat-containing protein